MLEKYSAQNTHWNPILVKGSPLQNPSEAKIRTVLSRFWTEKCIVGQNDSKTLPHTYKPHFIIRNSVSNSHVRSVSTIHHLVSVYDTVGPRSHPVRDTLLIESDRLSIVLSADSPNWL